jgi:GntR family transcriptional regulator
MFLTVDAEDSRPLYRQVADGIKALIARGDLREGMGLPSVRQVANDLGVNLNTVAIAYRELQEEGYVSIRHGSGAIVAQPPGRGGEDGGLRKALRTSLTEFVLAGLSDREIVGVVRGELEALRKKGSSR